jgi:phosphocarrier protein
MKEIRAIVKDKYGIHARPARAIYCAAKAFMDTRVSITDPETGSEVNGQSIMSILTLNTKSGSTLIIRAWGPHEKEAVSIVAEVINTFESEK